MKRCLNCNREISHPQARYGPVCAEKLGVDKQYYKSTGKESEAYINGLKMARSNLYRPGVDYSKINVPAYSDAMGRYMAFIEANRLDEAVRTLAGAWDLLSGKETGNDAVNPPIFVPMFRPQTMFPQIPEGWRRTNFDTDEPYQLYQSPRPPKKDYDADNDKYITARDFIVDDKTKRDLYKMNLVLGDLANLHHETGIINGRKNLEAAMKQLATIFTVGDLSMRSVVLDMFDHFINGGGEDYRNDKLTEKAIAHTSTQKYINDTKQEIVGLLSSNGGDLEALLGNSKTLENTIKKFDKNRPKFNTSKDLFNGLTIAVNDTWGCYIDIVDYKSDGEYFSGKLKYTFYDHFGLDDSDVTEVKGGLYGYTKQFGAWYVLQHYEACDADKYQPFVTYMETEVTFLGKVK